MCSNHFDVCVDIRIGMNMLPVEKLRLRPIQDISAVTHDKPVGDYNQQRKLFCYPFQFGNCSDKDCQLRH
jgi:hypothetical protein